MKTNYRRNKRNLDKACFLRQFCLVHVYRSESAGLALAVMLAAERIQKLMSILKEKFCCRAEINVIVFEILSAIEIESMSIVFFLFMSLTVDFLDSQDSILR